MRHYELTINTKEADSLLERVISWLPAAPIQEQKSPCFLSLEFYAEPETIKALEEKLKADSLRYMILSKKTSKKETKPRRRPIKPVSVAILAPSQKKEKTEEKVDIKQIDEKLEELLKEE